MSLITALHSQNERLVDIVCASGASSNAVEDGATPMHIAVGLQSDNALQLTKILLRYGGDPNVRSEDRLTPVHIAVIWGRSQILRLLLDNGGDPRKKDEDGRDAWDMAVKYGRKKCQKILQEFLDESLSDEEDHYTTIFNQHVSLFDSSVNRRHSATSSVVSDLNRGFVGSRLSVCSSVNSISPPGNVEKNLLSSADNSSEDLMLSVIAEETSTCQTPGASQTPSVISKNTETTEKAEKSTANVVSFESPESKGEYTQNSFDHSCKCSQLSPTLCKTPIKAESPQPSVVELYKGKLGDSFRNWTPKPFNTKKCIDSADVKQIVLGQKFLDVTSPDHCVVRQTPIKAEELSQIAAGIKVLDVTSPDHCELVVVTPSIPRCTESADDQSHHKMIEFSGAQDSTQEFASPVCISCKFTALQACKSQSVDSGIDMSINCRHASATSSDSFQTCFEATLSEGQLFAPQLPTGIDSIVSKMSRMNTSADLITEDDSSDYDCTTGRYVEYTQLDNTHESPDFKADLSVAEYIYTDTESNISLTEHRLPGEVLSNSSVSTGPSLDWKTHRRLSTARLENSFINITNEVSSLTNTELYNALVELGDTPGPIMSTTRSVYARKLIKLREDPDLALSKQTKSGYSRELQSYISGSSNINQFEVFKWEAEIASQFDKDDGRKWREGHSKMSFTYLLLDPRTTQNLPARHAALEMEEKGSGFKIFLSSIFYIGKGKKTRPYQHFVDAIRGKKTPSEKIEQIIDIWREGFGVVSLHVFHNIIPVEAYTREACMVEAIGLVNLTNKAKCNYYGVATTWPAHKKKLVGASILYKAYQIFLIEGERQLRPADVRKVDM